METPLAREKQLSRGRHGLHGPELNLPHYPALVGMWRFLLGFCNRFSRTTRCHTWEVDGKDADPGIARLSGFEPPKWTFGVFLRVRIRESIRVRLTLRTGEGRQSSRRVWGRIVLVLGFRCVGKTRPGWPGFLDCSNRSILE